MSSKVKPRCRHGLDCRFLKMWIHNDGPKCRFYHPKNELELAQCKPCEENLSIPCWHCEVSTNYRVSSFTCIEHKDGCNLPTCNDGERCWMFRYVQNSCGREQTPKLEMCIDHCVKHGHRVAIRRWCYSKITEILNNSGSAQISMEHSADIRAIMSRPGFDINHTNEQDPHNNPIVGNTMWNRFDEERWDSGFYNLLWKICRACDFETFLTAYASRKVKLDVYTLMECVKKGDIRYLKLIGKDKFTKHPNLRVPVSSNDPRFLRTGDDLINYQYASDVISDESYDQECNDMLKMWGF